MCDYLDCDALISTYTESNTRLQDRLDQQVTLIAAQKKRILEFVNSAARTQNEEMLNTLTRCQAECTRLVLENRKLKEKNLK